MTTAPALCVSCVSMAGAECRLVQRADCTRRASHGERIRRNVPGDHRSRSDDGPIADRHTRTHDDASAQPHVVAERDRVGALQTDLPWCRLQRVDGGEQLDVRTDLAVRSDDDGGNVQGREPVIGERALAELYMLDKQSNAPILGSLYEDADMLQKYPYLPTLRSSLDAARARPKAVAYGDVTAAIQDAFFPAIQQQTTAEDAISGLENKLKELSD